MSPRSGPIEVLGQMTSEKNASGNPNTISTSKFTTCNTNLSTTFAREKIMLDVDTCMSMIESKNNNCTPIEGD
jgi:hypothetical protein